MKKIILAVLLFLGLGSAQAQDKLKGAFQASYTQEYNKQYKEALATLMSFYDPLSYEINLRVGWLQYLNGAYAKSAEYYQKAAELAPQATEPLWGVVYPLSAMEKWTGVENVYKEILKRDAGNSRANYYLGLIYFNRKDYTNAAKYLNEAYKLYPFDKDTCLLLGWTRYYQGDKKQAKALFNKVLMQEATNTSALEGLGLCG